MLLSRIINERYNYNHISFEKSEQKSLMEQ